MGLILIGMTLLFVKQHCIQVKKVNNYQKIDKIIGIITSKLNLEEQLFWIYITAGEMKYDASVKNHLSSLSSSSWPKSFYLELVPSKKKKKIHMAETFRYRIFFNKY